MDPDTFDSTIRTFKHRRPFRPFTVMLVNGERVEVDHPEALVVRDGVGLYVGPGGVPAVFDHEGVAQVIGDLVRPPSTEPDVPYSLLEHRHRFAVCAAARAAQRGFMSEWRTTNWTQLSEARYYALIEQLRAVLPAGAPFWMLEEFWSPTEAEEETAQRLPE